MMDFKNARELLDLCSENHCPISTIMRERECDQGETTSEEADGRMRRTIIATSEIAIINTTPVSG